MTMKKEDYKKIVDEHYVKQAQQHKLSLTSTMPDLNTRRLEIENVVKYLEDDENCLEVGCGNGAASVEISKIKKINLLSIDATKKMIDLTKQQPTHGIRGNIEFRHQDVLKFNQHNSFDTVFTIRCIINLMAWNDQKMALTNIANAIKHGGKLILLEAFTDGLEELNHARQEVGLPPIKPAPHNLHLRKDLVIQHLLQCNLGMLTENNFLSSYYFGTRVIYPALAKANNVELIHNSKFDSFFSHFPPYGNFSHIKMLVFRKKN